MLGRQRPSLTWRLEMIKVFLPVAFFLSFKSLAVCSGVTWQSPKDTLQACLDSQPCLGVFEGESSNDALAACRQVLPCHDISSASSDSARTTCIEYQQKQGANLYSEIIDTSTVNVSDKGQVEIDLGKDSDNDPILIKDSSSLVGGAQTVNSNFNAGTTFNDESKLLEEGRKDIKELESKNSMRGQSYQTLANLNTTNPPVTIAHNDPILEATETSINSIDNDDTAFGNCIEVVDHYDSTIELENAKLQTCFEMVEENYYSGSCQVEKELINPIKFMSTHGGFSVSSCGSDCLRFKADVENLTSTNSCTIFDAGFEFQLEEGFSISSAKIIEGVVDDHVRGSIDNLAFSVSSSNWANFANGTQSCETSQRNTYFTNLFITNSVQQGFTDNHVRVNFENAVADRGSYTYDIEIKFNHPISVKEKIVKQTKEGCYDDLGENYRANGFIPEGFCKAEDWQCLESSSGGFVQGASNSLLELFGGSGVMCTKAKSNKYSCDPFGDLEPDGQVCFQEEVRDPDTNEIIQQALCYSANEISQVENNSCADLLNESQCVMESRECQWEDTSSGKCFNFRYEYKCSDPSSISINNASKRNICDSNIACAGGECDYSKRETNNDFVSVASQYSMASTMVSDRNCKDESDLSTCTIWPGEYEYCSFFPVGNDCCEGPSGVSIYDYVQVVMGMNNLDSQIGASEALAQSLPGDAWEAMRQPVVDAYSATTEALTNAWNSLSGNITGEAVTSAGELGGEAVSSLGLETIKQEMTNFVAELMPDALRDLLFDTTTDAAGQVTTDYVLDETVSNVMSNVMAVYTAYTMAKLAVNLLTQCDDNEQDAGLKIQMNQCIKVNNSINNDINNDASTCEKKILGVCVKSQHHYCCYNTPLARIVIEQALPMLNKTIDVDTDAKSCAGLTFEDIQALDWDKIDLSEWIGLMAGAGLLPTSESQTSAESLSGEGRLLNTHGRMTAKDRMKERIKSDELSQRQKEIWSSIRSLNIDCSVSNPPLVCSYRDPSAGEG